MSDETVDHVKELRGIAWRREYGGLCDYLDEVADALEETTEARDAAYRGRAELVAVLARAHDGAAIIVDGSDPEAPGWPIIYIETWAGQLSWHLNPADLDLFAGIPRITEEPGRWDGHTDAEKSRRLAAITLHTRKVPNS